MNEWYDFNVECFQVNQSCQTLLINNIDLRTFILLGLKVHVFVNKDIWIFIYITKSENGENWNSSGFHLGFYWEAAIRPESFMTPNLPYDVYLFL